MKNGKNKAKRSLRKNPLVGQDVWTVVVEGDITSAAVFTSFRKAMNYIKFEFREHDILRDEWEDAHAELKSQWYYHSTWANLTFIISDNRIY